LAFFGAYVTMNVAMMYLAVQKWRGDVWMGAGIGAKWKWSLGTLTVGVVGMSIALLVAGYEQSFIERAVDGSSWSGYFDAQNNPWFTQAMWWRMVFGWVTLLGYGLLVWDLASVGSGATRKAQDIAREEEYGPEGVSPAPTAA
jgi:nitric oxide reductase subunit B